MRAPAFQDYYPDDVAHCRSCGRLNPDGLHIESRWEGDEAACGFAPRPEHTAVPGYVYGGLLASLQVDFLRPTPLGPPLEVRARAEEIGEKKVVLALTLSAQGEVTVRGRVVAVRMPERMRQV